MQHTSDKSIIVTKTASSGSGSNSGSSAGTGARTRRTKTVSTSAPIPPDAVPTEATGDGVMTERERAAVIEEEEADAESIDASALYGAAGSGLAVSTIGLAAARRKFRLRLKYLLRTRIARDALTTTHKIPHKLQGALLNAFVDRTKAPADSELCAVSFDQRQIDLILDGSDLLGVGIGNCCF